MTFRLTTNLLFKLLFHLFFWGSLLVFPLLVRPQFLQAPIEQLYPHLIFVNLLNLFLFFTNTHLLIPRIFVRKGAAWYFLVLILLATVVVQFVSFLLNQVLADMLQPTLLVRGGMPLRFPVHLPVILVLAVSTAYGLIVHFNEQEQRKQAQQQEQLQSELSFLRSQISPHFIFNILNSIVYLIRTNSAQAEAVTLRLSELMRYVLYDAGDTQIPLHKELNYVRNYVELQRMRFDEDVSVVLHVEDEKLTNLVIEPMLLIPFIENAFKHGTTAIRIPIITIDIALKDNQLFFVVMNRVGMSGTKDNTSGIGIRNVSRRLELLYADAHRLNVEQSEEWFYVGLQLKLRAGC